MSRSRRLVVSTVLSAVGASLALTGTTPATATTTLVCRTEVVGLTATARLRSIYVVNGRVKRTLATANPLPFDSTGLAFKSYTSTGNGILGVLALHPSGTPRVIGVKYPASGPTLTTTLRPWEHSGFAPELFTGLGNLYYAVDDFGKLTKLTDATAQPKPMGGNFIEFATLQYAMTYRQDGYTWDVLYGTTHTGALKRVDVPVSRFSTIPSFTTLRSSGYDGVTELAVGRCNNDPFHHVVIAINPAAKSASWTTVVSNPQATPRSTTRRGPIQVGYNWALHGVF